MITNDFPERFLRLPEVQERTGFSRSFIYKSITDKTFSAPRKVGGRAIQMPIGPSEKTWDMVALVRYPSDRVFFANFLPLYLFGTNTIGFN